jgi:hypothetical protein
MTQTHGVLNYSSPARGSGDRAGRGFLAGALLLASAFVGMLVGVLAVRVVIPPVYQSSAIIYVAPSAARQSPSNLIPQPAQMAQILTAALSQTRLALPGIVIPAASSGSLHARIISGGRNGLMILSCQDRDPNIANSVTSELIAAYANYHDSSTPPTSSISVLTQPKAGVRGMQFAMTLGGASGAILFVWFWRKLMIARRAA